MKPVTAAALLFLSIVSQTSCLIEVKNHEFKKDEVFRGDHTEKPYYKAIKFSQLKGTIYSTSLSQLSDIDELWFGNSVLNKIEDGALCSSPGITKITFKWSNLPQLTSGTFANCVNLTVIDCHRNNVVNSTSKFSDDALPGLANLQTLTVSGWRDIPHVPKTLFKGLDKLKILRIDSTDLATVENGAFDDLVDLQTLDLNDNKLAVLDKALFSKLSKLEELDLSRNNLKNLDNGLLANLHSLEVLDISRNQLENLPWTDLVSLAKLRVLSFHSNKIKNLTASVDLVETLKKHWPDLEKLQFQQETMPREEVLAMKDAIRMFKKHLEMPGPGC